MRQINVYSFAELSEEAKQKVLNGFEPFTDHIYDEASQTVKEFHKLFGTREGSRSWLEWECNFDDAVPYKIVFPDVLGLTGLRLQKWIINNFPELYKKKCYWLLSKKDVSYKHYKNGCPVLKSRHSKIIMSNDCVLTGMCYDNDLLMPIYDFIERYRDKSDYYSYMDIETLFNDCFAELEQSIKSEIEYRCSDEAKQYDIEANGYEFLEDGRMV